MARYYFNVRDGSSLDDHEGVELSDLGAARQEALRIAAGLLRDSADEIWALSEWSMHVADSTGKEVITLRFSASSAEYSE